MSHKQKINIAITIGLSAGWMVVFVICVAVTPTHLVKCTMSSQIPCPQPLARAAATATTEVSIIASLTQAPTYDSLIAPEYSLIAQRATINGQYELVFEPIQISYRLQIMDRQQPPLLVNVQGVVLNNSGSIGPSSSGVLVQLASKLEHQEHHHLIQTLLQELAFQNIGIDRATIINAQTAIVESTDQWRALIDTTHISSSVQRLAAVLPALESGDLTSIQPLWEIDARLQMPVLRNFE